MGGETAAMDTLLASIGGLSPRGRGNRVQRRVFCGSMRSIPAWAGEPIQPQSVQSVSTVYPRVGGGSTWAQLQGAFNVGLSPRGRGNGPQPARSIPAWAGEPSSWTCDWFLCRVYPHVGGGTVKLDVRLVPVPGLSPRGRGNLDAGDASWTFAGSIPAWAGEPLRQSRRCLG